MGYDVAAYIWPAYTGDEMRSRIFWPEGIGEWQSVKNAVSKGDGHSWPRRPLWGYVNEADQYVMEMEINAAADHGVNVFIYDWYWYDHRPFLENCLNDGYLKAANNRRVQFYLMWANHDANTTWDIRNAGRADSVVWGGAVDRGEFDRIVRRIIERYFSHPSYYKIGGKPVFMIYDLSNLIRGLGGVEQTRRALEYFREETEKAGFPGLELQLTLWSEKMVNLSGVDSSVKGNTKEAVALLGFDSLTHYQFVHFVNVDREYGEILKDVQKEWERIDRDYLHTTYYPHISVGWDNNPRFLHFRPGVVRGNTPEAFEQGLRMAREYIDSHDLPAPLVTINSWNEWTETSYLEPDDLYGYGYLEAIQRAFAD